MACLGPAFSPRLAYDWPLVPALPDGQAHGRPALLRSRASSIGSLARGRAVGRCLWRLAAAAEPQAVEGRTEGSAEAGTAGGAAEASSKLVLVVGGTGGVGQLVVASLLSRNIKSRLFLRDPEKAASLFGKQDESVLQVYKGDTRNSNDLDPQMFEGVTHVICCTGTTAFPSKRWDGDNTPERVDWDGTRNLVSALPRTIKRLVFVSSIGVTKYNELPWSVMNLFGVLKYKKMAEDFVRNSGIPFTIIRLTDGPYTSYDLNTLLKATAGERRAVVIGKGDKLVAEVSRLVVAEACIQALDIEFTEGQIYEADSGNASWVEPDPDDLAFPGRDRAALWSDSSSDEEQPEVEAPVPVERATEEEEEAPPAEAVAKGRGAARWWKLPLDALRVWALRVATSAWSVPFAIALLGFAVLGRRLYRMRRQTKAVARVRLLLDEKKASQFKGQASRLNESMIVRRPPIIKPMPPANGVTPWPVLGLM